ncbi:hypothetical protein [Streptomyces exfoliatus]|uniref:hypothetical protein n=1 Tax=Streptomyces exfoliatus TaxID=1905 RepID=UPI003C30B84A
MATFGIAGCSGTGTEDGAGEPDAHIVNRIHTTDLAFPLDAYRLSPEEDMVLEQAIDALTATCMTRFGIQYKTAPPQSPTGQSRSRLYGVTEEREASVYGYRNPERRASGTSKKPTRTPVENAVLLGEVATHAGKNVPEGGCAAEASKVILSGPNKVKNIRLADNLIFASSAKTEEDSRVQGVFKKWSACMKESGYSYASPVAVLEDGKIFASPTPDSRETNMAVADVRCKKKYNVVGVWSSVEMAYQSAAIEQNAEDLKDIKENLRHAVLTANDAMAGRTA